MTPQLEELAAKVRATLCAHPVISLCIASVLLTIVFILFPSLDIAASAAFYGENGFWMQEADWAKDLRSFFKNVMIVMIILSIIGLLVRLLLKRQLFGVSTARWAFVLSAFIIGPGLVANTLLKDNWDRPRPVHITQFGGTTEFELPVFIDLDGEGCVRNCSFVSGEGSLAFMTGFIVLGFFGLTSPLAISLALAYGTVGSLLRIGMGGHFLSDTLFAGLFMAMIAIGLYRLLLKGDAGKLASRMPL